jgi:hypothetical protein
MLSLAPSPTDKNLTRCHDCPVERIRSLDHEPISRRRYRSGTVMVDLVVNLFRFIIIVVIHNGMAVVVVEMKKNERE